MYQIDDNRHHRPGEKCHEGRGQVHRGAANVDCNVHAHHHRDHQDDVVLHHVHCCLRQSILLSHLGRRLPRQLILGYRLLLGAVGQGCEVKPGLQEAEDGQEEGEQYTDERGHPHHEPDGLRRSARRLDQPGDDGVGRGHRLRTAVARPIEGSLLVHVGVDLPAVSSQLRLRLLRPHRSVRGVAAEEHPGHPERNLTRREHQRVHADQPVEPLSLHPAAHAAADLDQKQRHQEHGEEHRRPRVSNAFQDGRSDAEADGYEFHKDAAEPTVGIGDVEHEDAAHAHRGREYKDAADLVHIAGGDGGVHLHPISEQGTSEQQ
mmetsp:Transcript_84757/g.237298  ORF Transcript_84757/g.237298 Transcript_84757/m.237298 type:complete len:319 (+) Transcript_84757:1489-2445(+)